MTPSKLISTVLFGVALILIFIIPENGNPNYYSILLSTKALGILLGWAVYRLAPIDENEDEDSINDDY